MLGPTVLDTGQFAEIHFRSTAVERAGYGRWKVQGDLTLHGQTRPIDLLVVLGPSGRYQGSIELKQKDFGITPVAAGGGTVKVRNELGVEFELTPVS
jgi:polyisoprenoid-binding protein YceI